MHVYQVAAYNLMRIAEADKHHDRTAVGKSLRPAALTPKLPRSKKL
jgi:hypothetical protein